MTGCPAPKRIVHKIVDQSTRESVLAQNGVIIFCESEKEEYGYLHILREELSQSNWRFGPDKVWDELWKNFRHRWKIIVGTMPVREGSDWLAEGAPVCAWIAVQFDSDEDWGLYRLGAKHRRLRRLDLSEVEDGPPVVFDSNRIIPCPTGQRRISCTTDDGMDGLSNAVLVYSFDGQTSNVPNQRLTTGEIRIESGSMHRGIASPDGMFDFLYTKYRTRWTIYLNALSVPCKPRLMVEFRMAEERDDFIESWCGGGANY